MVGFGEGCFFRVCRNPFGLEDGPAFLSGLLHDGVQVPYCRSDENFFVFYFKIGYSVLGFSLGLS